MTDIPCKGCHPPKRHESCHDTCSEYMIWKKEKAAETNYIHSGGIGWVNPTDFDKRVKRIRKGKAKKR